MWCVVFINNQQISLLNFKVSSKNNVSFKDVPIVRNKVAKQADIFVRSSAFEQFISQIKNSYPQEKIMDVILKSAVSENFLGSGRCAKVYEIPNVKDFVVRILHDTKSENILNHEIKMVEDEFPNKNFGQKIADNDNGVTILKRVLGTSQGFPNPSEKDNDNLFLIDHARAVLNQIVEMSKFPQESFNDFALKVKEINKSSKYILDCLNPNNLLVDKENLQFNIVDLSERGKFTALLGCKQDSDDMISLLLNLPFHRKVHDVLPTDNEKELLIKSSKIIMNKVYRAAILTKLEKSVKNGKERLAIMNEYCLKNFKIDFMFLKRYEGFRDLYKK